MKRLKIAFLTVEDARDRRTWSGTNYFLWHSMQKHVGDVELVQPSEPTMLLFFLRLFNQLSLRLLNKRFDWRRSRVLCKAYAKRVNSIISGNHFDLLVIAGRTALFSDLETNIPIAYIGDRTVRAGLNYHEQLKNLFPFSLKQSFETEKAAFKMASLLTFPSSWACRSVTVDPDISKAKVFEIPFGANLDNLPARDQLSLDKINHPLTLLFLATRWKEKGGDIVVDCLTFLRKKGIDARLVICGCQPELKSAEHVEVIPFIDKNDPKKSAELENLFRQSDLLILPTRFDAYGIVFCEASTFGIPSLAPDTGGVGGAVKNGLNGFLLPYNATGEEYASKIIELLSDENTFLKLKESSRKLFEERLNWDSWGQTFAQAIGKIIK